MRFPLFARPVIPMADRLASTKRERVSMKPPDPLFMLLDITSGCSEWPFYSKHNSLLNNYYPRQDFHLSHGGNNRPGSNTAGCEGDGLMSFGSKTDPQDRSKIPDAWSTCSNDDFENWYLTKGHRCLRKGNVDDVMLCNSNIISIAQAMNDDPSVIVVWRNQSSLYHIK